MVIWTKAYDEQLIFPMVGAVKIRRLDAAESFLVFLGRRTFLGRGAARKVLIKTLRKSVGLHNFCHEYWGLVAVFGADNTSDMKFLFSPYKYNFDEISFVKNSLLKWGGSFVDLGANTGFFGLAVRAGGWEGLVVAVEPNPIAAARCHTNLISLNPALRGTTVVEQVAVGEVAGQMRFSVADGMGMGHLSEHDEKGDFLVEVLPLATVLARTNANPVGCMKIDVENWEDRVIAPYIETTPVEALPHSIIVERPSKREGLTEKILCERGYVEVGGTNANAFFQLDY